MLLFEGILFDYTGKGFTNEVFFHFEFESLRIGFFEYPVQILSFILLILIYVFLINRLLRKTFNPKNHLLTVIAFILLIPALLNSSLVRFVSGLNDYLFQDQVNINQTLIKQYVDLGVLQNHVLTTKENLVAESQPDSKNLILVYLESFNAGLLHLDQYPKLTPNLNYLSNKYQTFNHLSSSYVTIEGIISSQCGTMLPMTAGNNTFLNEGQLLSNMPCLGDVLSQAGYTQYYLGGAQMEFAGKGRFLKTHGYDHIWGLEHWKANGLRETKGIWGLSDSQLFKNSINTIKKAALTPPYHLTLLTLGTHLPGYVYDECLPYPDSDEVFINAIHCTDQLLGQFVHELEQAHLLENTVLMIVADHGVFPSVKMKELFADEVDDRRLVGITNYQVLPEHPVSSYDLTPTLIDMLNIEHNANFLFGKSIFSEAKNQQKYVTRYADWQDEKMALNPAGECGELLDSNWPLNKCHKQNLLSLTSQLLEHYSIKEQPEPLACELNVQFTYDTEDQKKGKWFLRLNGEDHFDHFYHKGYLLKTLNYRAGTFVFLLNNQLAIEKHLFIENNEDSVSRLKSVVNDTENPVMVIQSKLQTSETSQNGEVMSLSIDFYKDKKKMWSEKPSLSHINELNLCR